jgi:DNA mismatch repair protein MutS2
MMDERTIQDLQFETILHELEDLCLSEEGRLSLRTQPFLLDRAQLGERQDLVEDLIALYSFGKETPQPFPPISEALAELRKPGGRLDGESLFLVARYLESANAFTTFCRMVRTTSGASADHDSFGPAYTLFEAFDSSLGLLARRILDTLDAPGVVKPTHPAIMRLTREVEQKRAQRQAYSAEFLRSRTEVSAAKEPVFRDGRVVLPVRSDQRSGIEGFVHSSSSSGATVFVEPYRLVDLNNQVIMAQQQIQMEIARILSELSQLVKADLGALELLSARVAWADTLHARCRYAMRHRCTRPLVSEDGSLRLLQARHPLLRERAVPITMELDHTIKAVVISGPNAGGKTVTIKTVGLFVLMHQFLYLIPAAEGSVLPIFRAVHTDIGDEQSIEESLSTFSAHMRNIGRILGSCDSDSLLILDELGSGTDPIEGSALARAILEYCVDRAALTLVTSHHSVLKQYAYAHEHLINASMEFDGETHEPTFRIIAGLPGESHALDTARRMNLPEQVLAQATGYLGSEMVEISTIIRGLEEKRREAEMREKAMAARERTLQEQARLIDLKNLQLKQQEQLLRNEQIGDLSRFISEKRSELENLVAELREGEITREKTKKVKEFMASMELRKEHSERKARQVEQTVREKERREPLELSVGMDVLAGPHKREGRIVRREKNGMWLVAIGPMKFPMEERDLKPLGRKRQQEHRKVSISYEAGAVAPRPTVDVRGLTLEQALEVVKTQVEGALVHSVSGFSIIHGMGDGILARGIHAYLGREKGVASYYFARPEDGGHGKTYVEF